MADYMTITQCHGGHCPLSDAMYYIHVAVRGWLYSRLEKIGDNYTCTLTTSYLSKVFSTFSVKACLSLQTGSI